MTKQNGLSTEEKMFGSEEIKEAYENVINQNSNISQLKRGRKRETPEQKEERRLKKLNAIVEVEENEIIFTQLKNLQSGIKKGVSKLSSKEIEKLKKSLSDALESIDNTLNEVKEKEEADRKKKIAKEIEETEAKLAELKKQL